MLTVSPWLLAAMVATTTAIQVDADGIDLPILFGAASGGALLLLMLLGTWVALTLAGTILDLRVE